MGKIGSSGCGAVLSRPRGSSRSSVDVSVMVLLSRNCTVGLGFGAVVKICMRMMIMKNALHFFLGLQENCIICFFSSHNAPLDRARTIFICCATVH